MTDHVQEQAQEQLVASRHGGCSAARRRVDIARPAPEARALDAMAQAVRRSRELTQGSEAHSPDRVWRSRNACTQSVPGREDQVLASEETPPRRRPPRAEKVLQVCVVVVAALVLGFAGALAALHLHEPAGSGSVGAGVDQSRHHSHSSELPGGRPGASSAPPPAARTGPARAVENALAGQRPRLLSISPSAGDAGQGLTVSGIDLYSPDGLIQASLGGVDAPIRCVTQTSCVVTVPMGLVSARSLPLTIETEAGTSNALAFSYR